MILPNFPVTFEMLSPEQQAEGLVLLRELVRESFVDGDFVTDEQLIDTLRGFDLRLLMGQDDGLPEC